MTTRSDRWVNDDDGDDDDESVKQEIWKQNLIPTGGLKSKTKRLKTKSYAHRWVDRLSRRWEGLEASTYVGTGDVVSFCSFLTFGAKRASKGPGIMESMSRCATLYWLTSRHPWPCHWWKKTLTRGSILNVSANQRPLHHISSRPSWDLTSSNEKIFQRMCFPLSMSHVFWFQAD